MVRPAFPAYADENARLRDAARLLSGVRDRSVLVETCAALTGRHGDRLDRRTTRPFVAELEAERDAAGAADDLSDRIAAFRDALTAARAAARDWNLEESGWDAIRGGLNLTHGRARDAMKVAADSRDPGDLHAWRKRVKYHWYHARLLKRIFPPLMDAHRGVASDLADLLGDHHDLAVLRDRLDRSALAEDAKGALSGLIAADMARLERKAFALGRPLLAEKPKRLAARWGDWWRMAGG